MVEGWVDVVVSVKVSSVTGAAQAVTPRRKDVAAATFTVKANRLTTV